MATRPRAQSESGFYHVFQRGVNKFDIFEDDLDRELYLDRFVKYAKELGVEIHAWCLMSNHSHLLVRADRKALSALMQKLGSVYARRFNERHGRTGPLFEGRFCSVCVETDTQLLSVIRYIHRNPVIHEQAALSGDHPWSSYGEYVTASPKTCKLSFALALFGSVKRLVAFHEKELDHERHLDIGTVGPMHDDEARKRADRALEKAGFGVTASRIGSLGRRQRDQALACVSNTIGCSLRQLQRLTSIAYSSIRKAVSSAGNATIDAAPQKRAEPIRAQMLASMGCLDGISSISRRLPALRVRNQPI